MSAKVVSDFEPQHAVAQSHSLQNQVQKSLLYFLRWCGGTESISCQQGEPL